VDKDNYLYCVRHFIDEPKVSLVYGDSEEVIESLLAALDRPCVFWLDAHYNGRGRGRLDCPVLEEMRHIFAQNHPHIVCLDDIHLFGTDSTYPTVSQAIELVREITGQAYSSRTAGDVLVFTHNQYEEFV
jgi:hypothetical protein